MLSGSIVGNQLDTSSLLLAYLQYLSATNAGITNITGIEHFPNLILLDVSGNNLTFLPSLPASLEILICDNNLITALPANLSVMTPVLTNLSCSRNPLNALPTLPPALEGLGCRKNNLTLLPTLPLTLTYLDCDSNNLAMLPALPDGLGYLSCRNNSLTNLPTPMPSALTELICDRNFLTSIPLLPPGVWWISCRYNQIQSFANIPDAVQWLWCNNNQLTALPALPLAKMGLLDCSANNLTSLPALPDTLNNLNCSGNNLISLPAMPAVIQSLNCGNNQLTSLPALPSSLTTLTASNNQLTSLPPLPPMMYTLQVSNNLITAIEDLSGKAPPFPSYMYVYINDNNLLNPPALPDTVSFVRLHNNPLLACFPTVKHITNNTIGVSLSNTSITCLPNHVSHPGYWASLDTLPLCGLFGNTGCEVVWNIAGTVHADTDTSCIATQNETKLQNVKMLLFHNGALAQQVYTNAAGHYSFDTDAVAGYEVRVDTAAIPFYVVCPVGNSYGSTVSAADSLDFSAHFGLHCNGATDVGTTSVHTTGIFFPGQQTTVRIHAGDMATAFGTVCNTSGLAGSVVVVVNGPASYQAAAAGALPPTTVNGDTIAWSIQDFASINFYNDFGFLLTTDTSTQGGNAVCIHTYVTATPTDADTSNNYFGICFDVVNSYDPNDKQVYPATTQQPGGWHTYTVRFQNTGTAPAINILIKDTLDENLDWSSFQLLAYSHNNLTQIKQNGASTGSAQAIVHFNFPNIWLADSTSNEPESHGFIQYRIKTKSTITPGTIIHNTAAIYFDFNDPIITNDAVVTYCLPVETQQPFSICAGDSIQVGNQWLYQPGTYVQLLMNHVGCDSTVTTTVQVIPTAFALAATNNVLAASGGVAYQWYDCTSNLPISGATESTYVALENGTYKAHVIDANGCEGFTDCLSVTGIGITAFSRVDFAIFPNPSSGWFRISLPGHVGEARLLITDLAGRELQKSTVADNALVETAGLSAGSYIIVADFGTAKLSRRLVIVK